MPFDTQSQVDYANQDLTILVPLIADPLTS